MSDETFLRALLAETRSERDTAAAERNRQRARADRLQGVLDAILDAHTGCTADTCTTVAATEAAL